MSRNPPPQHHNNPPQRNNYPQNNNNRSTSSLPRILNVAEKPDAAKKIANILSMGSAQYRRGFSKYNPIYEFPFNLNGQQVLMVFTSVIGHLMNMDFPPEYRTWQSVAPVALFDTRIRVDMAVDPDKSDIAKTLREEASKAQGLILWLDCDREGENIGFEVINACKAGNSRLDSRPQQQSLTNNIKRARFSDLTQRAIQHAIAHLVAPNHRESDAVDARREIDLRLGAAFTRFQSLRLQSRFEGLSEDLISYGSCQFPTLGFIVRRYLKNQQFIPETFWKIAVTYAQEGKTANFLWKRGHLFDRMSSVIFLECCLDAEKMRITRVNRRPTTNRKPLPLNTVEMQKLASTHLRMSSAQAMNVAEELYNKSFISYPRTETDSFQITDQELQNLVQLQTNAPNWGQFAADLLNNNKYQRPRNGRNNDNAHPPIHPVKYPDEELNNDQKRLYELITRHFLACTAQDARGDQTTIHGQMGSEEFTCSGLMITERNYLDVYTYTRWSNRDIPVFTEGQEFVPSSVMLHEGSTSPPPLLTETALISLMDKNGIGTDATIAEHIKKIQERKYARKRGTVFEPTHLGLALVEAYTLMKLDLTRPEMRAVMESEMRQICLGSLSKEQMIEQTMSMYKSVFVKASKQVALLDEAVAKYYKKVGEGQSRVIQKEFSSCGICGNKMSYRTNSDKKKFLKCSTCKEFHNLPHSSDPKPHEVLCAYCNFQVLTLVNSKTKKEHQICPKCFSQPPDVEDAAKEGTTMRCFQCSHRTCPLAGKKKEAIVMPCPSCRNKYLAVKTKRAGGYFIGCNSYGKGNTQCSNAIWLPGNVTKVEVLSACPNCARRDVRAFRVKIEFSTGEPPMETCLNCDTTARNHPDWTFKLSSNPQPAQINFNRNASSGPNRSTSRDRGSSRDRNPQQMTINQFARNQNGQRGNTGYQAPQQQGRAWR